VRVKERRGRNVKNNNKSNSKHHCDRVARDFGALGCSRGGGHVHGHGGEVDHGTVGKRCHRDSARAVKLLEQAIG
jgi:hypothetical protein